MTKAVSLVVFQCLILFLLVNIAICVPFDSTLEKKSAIPDRTNDDYEDYPFSVRYDEYPMIVPKKRTALLVNTLMVALKDALEKEERERNSKLLEKFGSLKGKIYNSDDIRSMDLQRRGHQSITNGQVKGHNYWRCYFNAVTCF
ncbi:uncharacterized protein LOC115885699 [Sitophilus oryzae]|uniref:Uncharacterized protein LOC115885699 n=1 Tax=Sitophilus oryzae TaxID=7048 RepID=A0A6J2Y9J6_SITOR|nr:uncharacterized protein LOC115885699 [Sitophilus oryzae]